MRLPELAAVCFIRLALVEDGIIHLLHRANMHRDRLQSTVRVMFFDFSSAFDTLKSVRLAQKLFVMQVDQDLVPGDG